MSNPRTGTVALTTETQYLDLSGSGCLWFRVNGDNVRIGFDQFSVDNGDYMILDDGTSFINDRPNPFSTSCYVRADSGTATIRWMVTG